MFTGLINKYIAARRHRMLAARLERLPQTLAESSAELKCIFTQRQPRILVVKQDVNEDLYCCPSGTGVADLICSTLLRTGPVALFTELAAEFQIIETVDDPECQVWQERATELKWDTLEFFSSYRDQVPGRDYGQRRWAISPDHIDWNRYDIVISMDVCVPERITRQFPKALWCYYVREIKAPSYRASLNAPAPGQDIVLNHCFRLHRPDLPSHVLEFPYHLQRPDGFHRLFRNPVPPMEQRNGVFVDHHTMVHLSADQRKTLTGFGEVASTIHAGDREVIPTSERIARRTMDDDLRERLLNSRYFLITPGQRQVFGTAMIEAIAAGCLVIGNPESLGAHSFFFSPATSAADVSEAIQKMKQLEADLIHAAAERLRQQQLLDYLCYVRPTLDLLDAWQKKSPSNASLTTD